MRRLHTYVIRTINGVILGPFTSKLIARRELASRNLTGVVLTHKVIYPKKPKATS